VVVVLELVVVELLVELDDEVLLLVELLGAFVVVVLPLEVGVVATGPNSTDVTFGSPLTSSTVNTTWPPGRVNVHRRGKRSAPVLTHEPNTSPLPSLAGTANIWRTPVGVATFAAAARSPLCQALKSFRDTSRAVGPESELLVSFQIATAATTTTMTATTAMITTRRLLRAPVPAVLGGVPCGSTARRLRQPAGPCGASSARRWSEVPPSGGHAAGTVGA
jgi:hypothetical protein